MRAEVGGDKGKKKSGYFVLQGEKQAGKPAEGQHGGGRRMYVG